MEGWEEAFEAASSLESIRLEVRRMNAVLEAFMDSAGLDMEKINVSDIDCRQEHYRALFEVVQKYACLIYDDLGTVMQELYEYSRTSKVPDRTGSVE